MLKGLTYLYFHNYREYAKATVPLSILWKYRQPKFYTWIEWLTQNIQLYSCSSGLFSKYHSDQIGRAVRVNDPSMTSWSVIRTHWLTYFSRSGLLLANFIHFLEATKFKSKSEITFCNLARNILRSWRAFKQLNYSSNKTFPSKIQIILHN